MESHLPRSTFCNRRIKVPVKDSKTSDYLGFLITGRGRKEEWGGERRREEGKGGYAGQKE